MSTASNDRIIRCFAVEDEALVDEYPVAVDDATLRSLVPAPADDPELTGIFALTPEVAERLIARPLDEFSEPVTWFLEPRAPTPPGPEDR